MSLKTFDPFRKTFVCKFEADAVPPIDPEAEQWLQEGLRLTSHLLWPNQRDYVKAAQLWQKAADRKHWKAMLNLANAYAVGDGVTKDTEQAVTIVEAAMKLGIPSAYDMMGTFHMKGIGVKGDSSRAYAFWELGSDLGSASAQAHLGPKLAGTYSDPKQGFWGNRTVALAMLECAYAQGSGKGAYELALTTEGTDPEIGEDNARALKIYHDGVKFGNSDSAGSLFGSFDQGDEMVGNADHSRADRYMVFSDALRHDPDLRLPNLDKVLPLPPAKLPQWDGDKWSLINAAKAVVPKAPPARPPSFPASVRTGRAHIPDGQTLPATPPERLIGYENTSAPESGYWLVRLLSPWLDRHHAWNAEQVPMRYVKGERFDRSRPGLRDDDGRIEFDWLGQPQAWLEPGSVELDIRVARGIARSVDMPADVVACRGRVDCPRSGIWSANVALDHPRAAVFNGWDRQAYVERRAPFPVDGIRHVGVAAQDVTWRWMGGSNDVLDAVLTRIRPC